jgi:hypothetical protein
MVNNLKIFIKWTVLVWINAASSFRLSLREYSQAIDRIGIACGIFTFVILYTKIDIHLVSIEKFQ